MLTITGKFIFAAIFVLSQFMTSYSDQQIKTFLDNKKEAGLEIEDWEIQAYQFKPRSLEELLNLSKNPKAMADYVRAACTRIQSEAQDAEAVERGDLVRFAPQTMDTLIDEESMSKHKKSLLPEEQGISFSEAKKIMAMACDVGTTTEELEKQMFIQALNYVIDIQLQIPSIPTVEVLRQLPGLTTVRNKSGQILGTYSQNEKSLSGQILRRHNRIIHKGPIPEMLKKALVSIEDDRFWNFKPKGSPEYKGHKGVDFLGMMRAFQKSGSGSVQGGSTITMQLVKNLLLFEDVANEQAQSENGRIKRSLKRKLKEYMLVQRLERDFSKDEILELYLNLVDFGRNSQGIVMAARNYFGKLPEDLSINEIALLVGLPKNPYGLDPNVNMERATKRRNLVLSRMKKFKHITRSEMKQMKKEEIATTRPERAQSFSYAGQYLNAVQNQMRSWSSHHNLSFFKGYELTVAMNEDYQKWAVEILQRHLLDFERNPSRNPKKANPRFVINNDEDGLPNIKEEVSELANKQGISTLEAFSDVLKSIKHPYEDAGQFVLGVILPDGLVGTVSGKRYRRHYWDRGGRLKVRRKKKITSLRLWDVVLLQKIIVSGETTYRVASMPKVTGAVAVVDNKTGEVLAAAGRFSVGRNGRYKGSAGNNAFSAFRRPGSTIKPLAYLYYMMNGLGPGTSVKNVPITMPERYSRTWRGNCPAWSVGGASSGTRTLREGLVKSSNAVTVQAFANMEGQQNRTRQKMEARIDDMTDFMKSYGLYRSVEQPCYTMLLGTELASPIQMASAYATLANRGVYHPPRTVKRIVDGDKAYEMFPSVAIEDHEQMESATKRTFPNAYFDHFRLQTMMQGVVSRGTARRISRWSKLMAGKTGTTKGNVDAWFVGYNNDITVAVWVGYPDEGLSLSEANDGAGMALPIYEEFMESYYKKHPERLESKLSTQAPPGGVRVWIEPESGIVINQKFRSDYKLYTGRANEPHGVREYFRADYSDYSAKDYSHHRNFGWYFFSKMTKAKKAQEQADYDYNVKANIRYYDQLVRECNNNPVVESGALTDALNSLSYWGNSQQTVTQESPACRELRGRLRPQDISFKNYWLKKYGFNY